MRTTRNGFFWGMAAAGIAALLAACAADMSSQRSAEGVSIGENDLGGVVTGAKGPEAGVWVIAETTDLPTKYAKIVVTDDARALRHARTSQSQLQRMGARLRTGRFAQGADRAREAPQPHRGPRAECRPRPRSITRPSTGTRCSKIPAKSEFPGTGPKGNGIAEGMRRKSNG